MRFVDIFNCDHYLLCVTSYVPKYQYSIDEWIKHFDYFVRLGRSNKEDLLQYFTSEYPGSREEGLWKLRRFDAGFRYLLNHVSDFEKHIVVHERMALVSRPMVAAAWRYFGPIPDEHLYEEPSPSVMLQLADEEAEV
jgi:hypothetical protein